MSDLGSEMGNSGMSIMSKIMEALMKLIMKIFETIEKRASVEYRMKKVEYGQLKTAEEKRKFAEKIDGMAGYVRHKDLVKAGVPLTTTGLHLSDKDFKELADRCKRMGIIMTGIEDMRDRELTGRKTILVECKESDLPLIKELVDLMNDEKRIDLIKDEIFNFSSRNDEILNEIREIENNGDLTSEESKRIAELESERLENDMVITELNKQVDDIRFGHSQSLNKEQAEAVFDKAVNGDTNKGISFDEAVDRWTGRRMDKDMKCYIVDATDPDKYIITHSSNDVFKGNDYIKTTYEVYNGSSQVYATHDGRFEGRPADYWFAEKEAMQSAGGIGDVVFKFNSLQELESYRANYKMENARELDSLSVGAEGRNYNQIINNLESKLHDNGGLYKDGILTNVEDGKVMMLNDGMSAYERASVAESNVISKQIDNYKDISRLEDELSVARTNVFIENEETPEYKIAQEQLSVVENKYNTALDKEQNLIEERKNINAMQAEQLTSSSRTIDVDRSIDVETLRSAVIDIHDEKQDDRRDERVDEMNDKERTLAEYKGQIQEQRKDGAKMNDLRDRDISKDLPNTKGDR